MTEEIIGDYKIEVREGSTTGVVRKALGPWPLRNWSWTMFYIGSVEQCRRYVEWAQRIDAGDKQFMSLIREKDPGIALHCPLMAQYPFEDALAIFPTPANPDVEVSGELVFAFLIFLLVAAFGFYYHG